MDLLIVEDEASLARLMALELQHAGFRTALAACGEDALFQTNSHSFDCVILDVMLPDLSGLEVCRRIRAVSDTPIIMVTARGQIPDKVAGLELGADDYVVKPVNTEELAARIRAVSRRRQGGFGEAETVYSMGNVTLSREQHRLTVEGVEISLTPLEFRMLEHFLANHDRVQSRTVLLDAVWGADFIGDTNLIDVAVGRLRRRLQSVHADAAIETVRGVGYVLRSARR